MPWTLRSRPQTPPPSPAHPGQSAATAPPAAAQDTTWERCGAPGPWLVVVPHDDDLVLGMGLAVQSALAQGIEVQVAVVSDGRMGYSDPAQRPGIVARRRSEMLASARCLGLAAAAIHDLGFPDGDLGAHQGCRSLASGAVGGIAYALTGLMRSLQVRTAFGPTAADLHPDHVAVAQDLAIACFHAAGEIWLEQGEPITLPARFDYAVYCAFPQPPTVAITADEDGFQRKLRAIACFASQRQIRELVAQVEAAGAQEYLCQAAWEPYRPQRYQALFAQPGPPGASATGAMPGAGFRSDCARVTELLERWPAAAWPDLAAAFRASHERPVLLIGEGSSRLFPAALARALALSVPDRVRFEDRGGRDALAMPLERYQALLVSNSGRTRELVELLDARAPAFARTPPLALVGVAGGALPARVPATRVLLERGEVAVAATVSVVAQALTVAQALCEAAGLAMPRAALAQAVAQAQALELPADIQRAQRVWWGGGEHGASGELALKTMETAGITGIHLPGTLVLHGIEEVLSPEDVVVLFHPDARDRQTARTRLEPTGCRLLIIGCDADAELQLPELQAWSGVAELVAGWRLLAQLAARLGNDADRPRRARKVGNECVQPPA